MISWLKENNVAVITGGANGIGRSAVDAFLARGLHVVAIDRDEQALGDLKAAAAEASKLMVVTCDVSDYAGDDRYTRSSVSALWSRGLLDE